MTRASLSAIQISVCFEATTGPDLKASQTTGISDHKVKLRPEGGFNRHLLTHQPLGGALTSTEKKKLPSAGLLGLKPRPSLKHDYLPSAWTPRTWSRHRGRSLAKRSGFRSATLRCSGSHPAAPARASFTTTASVAVACVQQASGRRPEKPDPSSRHGRGPIQPQICDHICACPAPHSLGPLRPVVTSWIRDTAQAWCSAPSGTGTPFTVWSNFTPWHSAAA